MSTQTRDLTQGHRAQQLLLRKATLERAALLWPALDWANLDETYPAFAAQAFLLVQRNRATSTGLTAKYLRMFRAASGLTGAFAPVLATLPPEQFSASLAATSIAAVKTSASHGVAADVAMTNALTQYSGAMVRLVLAGGRETFTQTLQADPKAVGYTRVLGTGGCDFCQMLAGRGAVYGAESVDFPAHDKCACTGVPVYA